MKHSQESLGDTPAERAANERIAQGLPVLAPMTADLAVWLREAGARKAAS
jgi:hypothetical protein